MPQKASSKKVTSSQPQAHRMEEIWEQVAAGQGSHSPAQGQSKHLSQKLRIIVFLAAGLPGRSRAVQRWATSTSASRPPPPTNITNFSHKDLRCCPSIQRSDFTSLPETLFPPMKKPIAPIAIPRFFSLRSREAWIYRILCTASACVG